MLFVITRTDISRFWSFLSVIIHTDQFDKKWKENWLTSLNSWFINPNRNPNSEHIFWTNTYKHLVSDCSSYLSSFLEWSVWCCALIIFPLLHHHSKRLCSIPRMWEDAFHGDCKSQICFHDKARIQKQKIFKKVKEL